MTANPLAAAVPADLAEAGKVLAKLQSQIGDDVQDVYPPGALHKLSADTIAALLARIAAQEAREAALAVLAGLSSYLGTGLGDDDTTAEQFDKRIRWAIDDLTARTRQAALREAAALCDGEERSGGTGWECRDAILALLDEARDDKEGRG